MRKRVVIGILLAITVGMPTAAVYMPGGWLFIAAGLLMAAFFILPVIVSGRRFNGGVDPVNAELLTAIRCISLLRNAPPAGVMLRVMDWLERNPGRRTDVWAAIAVNNEVKYRLGGTLTQAMDKARYKGAFPLNGNAGFENLKRFLADSGHISWF